MVDIGRYNTLKVLRLSAKGAHLEDSENTRAHKDILLPARFVPQGTAAGSMLDVFVYLNSEGLLTATTVKPAAQVGEVAWLKIISVNDNGAFLSWGLAKDLLLPYNEVPPNLKAQLEPGKSMLVMVFQGQQGRLAASARLDDFLDDTAIDFQEGDPVAVIVDGSSEIGLRVIVNHRYWGIVHNNEIFKPLSKGDKLTGYIKTLRADHKLNISLTAPGPAKVDGVAQNILNTLASHAGFMAVSDKTAPEVIYQLFGISKKVFKQAIGRLYKERRIVIEPTGIRSIDKN